jgi:hypothetical protein
MPSQVLAERRKPSGGLQWSPDIGADGLAAFVPVLLLRLAFG